LNSSELTVKSKEYRVPIDLVNLVAKEGRLPVVNFAAGGIATPADAALCMQLGVDGVFVGSGIFKSSDPVKRAKAIVDATAHFNDPARVAKASEGLGDAMKGLEVASMPDEQRMAKRGV
jgi:pyridoxal 5'-phosphate synthase pdxS subunit